MILVLAFAKWTVDFVGDTIILVSRHKVLTFSSRLECESGGLATCFAMNPDSFVVGGYVGLFPDAIDPSRNFSVIWFTREL